MEKRIELLLPKGSNAGEEGHIQVPDGDLVAEMPRSASETSSDVVFVLVS